MMAFFKELRMAIVLLHIEELLKPQKFVIKIIHKLNMSKIVYKLLYHVLCHHVSIISSFRYVVTGYEPFHCSIITISIVTI